MKKLVLASNNKHKVKEIKAILSDYEVLTLNDVGIDIDVEETGTTFSENAYIKAKTIYDIVGMATIADDSGLMVDALGGSPGVYSARYSGEHGNDHENNLKVLRELSGVENRDAKFVSAIVMIDTDGSEYSVIGETKGKILLDYDGEGGFGYDPIFYSYELNKSFGRATPEEKNSVSHRRKALDNLAISLIKKN